MTDAEIKEALEHVITEFLRFLKLSESNTVAARRNTCNEVKRLRLQMRIIKKGLKMETVEPCAIFPGSKLPPAGFEDLPSVPD